MHSVIIILSARLLCPILMAMAIAFLYRGHNDPGGGFIGGLLFTAALILKILAIGAEEFEKHLWMKPKNFLMTGLIMAFTAGIMPLFVGKAFLQSLWFPTFSLPILGDVHIGSPLLFDLGVFMVVIGFVLTVIIDFEEAV
ncbi:Domain putative MnhB subunit of Na+/H+ antiporter superfamily protein [Lentisphaera araneosa HTCC2155]|jgi:multisubunit Na+/H+ antiporter MnhB subunit|uniref:Domain putative MnhB subunit of Na+/H+ antiporter superfamily protein n=1 Tax=Lentisphaera araneosa HTCC2155 TaxID=313628 RepID=A6DPK6_9BACT|nr:MnhB domain-containing protein [Lentisphaera araneosa]EDM26502.1 Domain putative MnhB subunit of Na+/H+ antiporter superfamily protein [Lentisphaera araneosa HTCC2155]